MKKVCVGLLAATALAAASFAVYAATSDFFYPKGAFKVRWDDKDYEDSFSLKAWTGGEYSSNKDPDWIGAYVELEVNGNVIGGYVDDTGKIKDDWVLVKLIKGGGGFYVKLKHIDISEICANAGIPSDTGGNPMPVTSLAVRVTADNNGSVTTLYDSSWYYSDGVHYRYKANGKVGKGKLMEPHY